MMRLRALDSQASEVSQRRARQGDGAGVGWAARWSALAGAAMSVSLGVGQTAAFGALSTGTPDPKIGAQQNREFLGQLAQANAPFEVAREISAVASDAIPLRITLADPNRSPGEFIIIHGLPEACRISAGFRTKNSWLVSGADLDSLSIAPPPDFAGKFTLRIVLVQEGKKTEEQSVMVNIRQTPTEPAGVFPTVGTTSSLDGSPAASPEKRLSDSEENTSMQRAAGFLANADIAAARLLYETLAMRGSARAAFAMGTTFDPKFLVGARIEGLKPDIELARRWYKKAALLGSQDAKVGLANLDGQ